MLLAGDEFCHSQRGNNNTYGQDNELSWLNWDLDAQQQDFLDFVKKVIVIWQTQPVFQRRKFFLGRSIRGKIDMNDMVKDIRAAVKSLAGEGLKVGVVGYCLGGTLAWLAATRVDGVRAAVSYYGGGVADTATETPRCPVLFHFGETDQSIPPEHHTRIRAAQPNLPMHIYPAAGHGFSCDERGSYHKESAALARTRTLEFLAKNV